MLRTIQTRSRFAAISIEPWSVLVRSWTRQPIRYLSRCSWAWTHRCRRYNTETSTTRAQRRSMSFSGSASAGCRVQSSHSRTSAGPPRLQRQWGRGPAFDATDDVSGIESKVSQHPRRERRAEALAPDHDQLHARALASGMQVSAVGSRRHSRTVRSITIAHGSSPSPLHRAAVRVSIKSAGPSRTACHASWGATRDKPFRASAKAESTEHISRRLGR